MILVNIAEIFSNPADIVFFSAILAALVLMLVIFIVSKVIQKQRDKKYEAIFEAKKKEEVAAAKGTVEEEPTEESVVEEVVEEEPVEESVVEEVVEEEPVEEPVVEEVVEEEPVEEPVVEEVVEEEPAEEPVVEEVVEEEPVEESVVEEVVEEEPVEEPIVEEVLVKKTATKKTQIKKTTKKTEETEVTQPKGRTYNGKYEIYPSGDGYQYRLKASNGEVLIVSEVYASREGVIKAIDAVKRNVETGEIRIIEDKHGKFKFKLTSRNYRVLALGSNYSTEKSAVRASESFKKFAVKADIVEIEAPQEVELASTVVEIGQREDKNGGKYVYEKFNGEYSWDLKATNGQILCQAEGYTSKIGVLNSIETFKRNVELGSFKIIKDKSDHYHFNLYSPSGRVVAIGETYASKQLAESAVNSVVSFYKNAEIIEKKETVEK